MKQWNLLDFVLCNLDHHWLLDFAKTRSYTIQEVFLFIVFSLKFIIQNCSSKKLSSNFFLQFFFFEISSLQFLLIEFLSQNVSLIHATGVCRTQFTSASNLYCFDVNCIALTESNTLSVDHLLSILLF